MVHIRSLRQQKYGNIRVKDDGYSFDSKREHKRYCELRMLAKAGKIEKLRVHPRFNIEIDGEHICTYEADFSYLVATTCNNTRAPVLEERVEDVKSPATKTPLYELKKKLMKAILDITVEEV